MNRKFRILYQKKAEVVGEEKRLKYKGPFKELQKYLDSEDLQPELVFKEIITASSRGAAIQIF